MDEIIILALAKKYTDSVGEKVSREGFHVQVEQDRSILNSTGQEKIFYFLPKTSDNPTDGYDEFVYTNNNWEQIGATDVDLSSYATKTEVGDLNNLPTTDKSSIVSAISETFTSVSNGKTLVASAITDKGVSTSSDATFATMAQNIANIPSGGTLISKTITENGVYNATDDNADGYDVVTVSVPEKNTLDEYFANTLEIADISSATTIPSYFFNNKTNLINVIMPNVTTIDNSAFQDCSKLALTSLPSTVTVINHNAFVRCKKLALTSLPSTVTAIAGYAFSNCVKIPYLDFSDFTSIPTVANTSFYGTSFPFYFHDQQQLDEWAAATNWSTYANRFQIKPSEVI